MSEDDDELLAIIQSACQVIISIVKGMLTAKVRLDALLPIDSDEEEEEIPPRKKRKTSEVPRVRNYISEVIPLFNDKTFQSHFRVSREVFSWLLGEVGPSLTAPALTPRGVETGLNGRPVTDAQRQLLSVLWLLATPDSFRSVSEQFGMSKSMLHKCFYRVVTALTALSPKICRWPNERERARISREFKRVSGMDGIVAVIDGTYVPIKAPKDQPNSYVNRKCFHGITLQGICDDRRRFVDVFAGYPSSVSDTRIFQNSDIYKDINREPDRHFSPHQYMLGDKAYETKTYCVPPYKRGNRYTEWQQEFNYRHAKCRSIIERTFALFFGRFRRFKYLDMNRTDWIAPTILAGTVLHNICLLKGNDDLQEQFQAEGLEFVRNNPAENRNADDHANTQHSNVNTDGRDFRDELAREMGLLRDRPPRRTQNPVDQQPEQANVTQPDQPDYANIEYANGDNLNNSFEIL